MITSIEAEKPSERILFALQALEEFEKPDSKVRPNMTKFFFKNSEGICFACLGGMAAIKRFNLDIDQIHIYSDRYLYVQKSILHDYEESLDSARLGWISYMFKEMGLPPNQGGLFTRSITDYKEDPVAFKQELRQLAADLEKAGY